MFFMVLMAPALLRAYDFSLTVPSGQTLYFDTVEGGVEVVRPNNSTAYINSWQGFTKPTGALTIPASITVGGVTYPVVAVADYAFCYCDNLTTIEILNGVSSLGDKAFYMCTYVNEVRIPASVTSIGNQTFGTCSSLSNVWVALSTPPETHAYAFHNSPISTATLHVPSGSYDNYFGTAPWSGFGIIDASSETASLTLTVNQASRGSVTGGGTFDVGTTVLFSAQAADGYRFICWNDGDTLNPRYVTLTHDVTFKAMFFAVPRDTVVVSTTEPVYVHDTVTFTDTIAIVVPVVDTVWMVDSVPVADTVTILVPVTDTVWVNVPDTVWATDTIWRYVTVYDTLIQMDTIYPTLFRLQVLSDNSALGVGVGSGLLPAGLEVEICALPLNGGHFLSWSDGSTENPRKVTLLSNLTLTAQFEQLGIEKMEKPAWTLGVAGREVTLTGVGEQQVRVYDVAGRQLASASPKGGVVRMVMPSAGVFVIRVGEWSARKVIIE